MRIIKCGNKELSTVCRHCGCTIAFTENEIKTDTTGRFYGYNRVYRFIACPQCNYSIDMDSADITTLDN